MNKNFIIIIILSVLYTRKPLGVSPDEAASEIDREDSEQQEERGGHRVLAAEGGALR